MRFRTVEATRIGSALQRIRRELGPHAVIISTRTVRKRRGPFGLFSRRMLEVTAAVEESNGRPSPPGTPHGREDAASVPGSEKTLLEEVRALRDAVGAIGRTLSSDGTGFGSEVEQVRNLVAALIGEGRFPASRHGTATQRLLAFLLSRGVDEPLARGLMRRVVARTDPGALADPAELRRELAAEMRKDLSRAERGAPPGRVQLFVGPSGVGKTTTIAKLALRASRSTHGGVAIATADTERVAAVEKVTRLGEHLGIPVWPTRTPEALVRVLRKTPSVERVFVDMPGRSHREPGTLADLRRWADAVEEGEVLLCLPAASRPRDSREILSAYAPLPYSRLVMTKLDETGAFGELYNCVVRSRRPLACVTTGQSIPEDLECLDVDGILRRVLHV